MEIGTLPVKIFDRWLCNVAILFEIGSISVEKAVLRSECIAEIFSDTMGMAFCRIFSVESGINVNDC